MNAGMHRLFVFTVPVFAKTMQYGQGKARRTAHSLSCHVLPSLSTANQLNYISLCRYLSIDREGQRGWHWRWRRRHNQPSAAWRLWCASAISQQPFWCFWLPVLRGPHHKACGLSL